MAGRLLVASASGNRRRQEDHRGSSGARTAYDVTPLCCDSADVITAQIIEIERLRNERSKAFDHIKDITSPDLSEKVRFMLKSNMLNGLALLLKNRIDTKYSYLRLFTILIFFIIYSTTIIIQRDISNACGVQSRCEKYESTSTCCFWV